MELCVAEGTAGQHHGGSASWDAERPHHPYLCFSWLCKHHFFLSSTASKYNHAKLMAYTLIKLFILHWSLQHGVPKLLLTAHLNLVSSRFLFGSWTWTGNPDCASICFSLEQWFLGGGSATIQKGRKVPMSEVSSLPEGFNNGLLGYFWRTCDEAEPIPGLEWVKAACQGCTCRSPPLRSTLSSSYCRDRRGSEAVMLLTPLNVLF